MPHEYVHSIYITPYYNKLGQDWCEYASKADLSKDPSCIVRDNIGQCGGGQVFIQLRDSPVGVGSLK